MPRLDNTNSALTEQLWQQFQADNPGASWADFRAAFPINSEVVQQAGPMGSRWVVAPQAPNPGMLTELNPWEQAQQRASTDSWYEGNYANYLQALNGAQAGFNDALQGQLSPDEWRALQAVQLNNPIMWMNTVGDNQAIGPNSYQVDPREYLKQRFGTFDTNELAKLKGIPLMPTLDQGNQQAKPYQDYLASLNTLRSQIPVTTGSFPTASPISSGTTMLTPSSSTTNPAYTAPISYPTVGDSSAWMANPGVQTEQQQRRAAGMLYS